LSAEDERSRGKCPLTPHEVGLMLRALGFGNDTLLYVASGEIYGGDETLQPLRELFPNFYTKEKLARDDLNPFLPFSSRLAAIDFIVCDESDVFVTNNNGNMAKVLAGRRYVPLFFCICFGYSELLPPSQINQLSYRITQSETILSLIDFIGKGNSIHDTK
jgi:hypothetical protein